MKRGMAFLLGVLASCNAILGNEEPTLRASADSGPMGGSGGASGNTSVDASQDMSAPPPDAPIEAGVSCDGEPESGVLCPGGVMYVSKLGSESNSGCTPCTPKLTIRTALDALSGVVASVDAGSPAPSDAGGDAADAAPTPVPPYPLPPGFTVRVCEGVYAEVELSLTVRASLEGGYDCTTWRRTADYGFPNFDAVNETRITNGAYTLQSSTFVVSGSAVDSSVTLDGLTVEGASSGTSGSVALHVAAGASPVVSNNRIVGGATTAGASLPGSIGVYVLDGASPEIRENDISGGSGTGAASRGSVGLYLEATAGAPFIHDNAIDGGSGTAPSAHNGSVGALLQSTLPLTEAGGAAFSRNRVSGGTGVGGVPGASATTVGAVLLGTSPVDILDNEIRGGDSDAPGTLSMGIHSQNAGAGAVRIARNRVDAGSRTGANSHAFGIEVQAASSPIVVNNMVHGGHGTNRSTPLYVVGTTAAKIAYNTLFGGVFTDSTFPIGQIWFNGSPAGAEVHSNILAGPSRSSTSGIRIDLACPGGLPVPVPVYFSRLRSNLFVGNGSRLLSFSQSICSVYEADTIAELTAMVTPGESAGNLAIKESCDVSESGTCIAEPSCGLGLIDGGLPEAGPPLADCMRSVFATWTEADDGLTELFTTGWVLRPNSLCSISGGAFADAAASTDLFGAARTNPRSIGADEFNEPCQ